MSYWLNAVDINSRQLPLKATRICMWTKKATKQLPELNILSKLFHSAVGVFHLNARLSFHQHMRQKHRASVSLTLAGWPGAAASVCGSPPAAGCCPTLNPHCILGPERSSPDSAVQGLERVEAQHNPGAPSRFKDRGVETGKVLNEKNRIKWSGCNLQL